MKTVSPQVLNLLTEADRVTRMDPDELRIVRLMLLRRARLLPPSDRQLLEMSLGGHNVRELAKILGRHPGSISRRINELKRRLCSEVVAALAEHADDLPDHYRAVGIAHFVAGQCVRAMGRQLGLSHGEISEIIGYLRAWAMVRAMK